MDPSLKLWDNSLAALLGLGRLYNGFESRCEQLSVSERVVSPVRSLDFDANLIWGTDGDLSRTGQPSLADAILSRARVGGNTHATAIDEDRCHAQRSRDIEPAIVSQIELRKDLAATLDDSLFGDPCLPRHGKGCDRASQAECDQEPVARLQQGDPADHGSLPAAGAASSRCLTRTRAQSLNSRANHSAKNTDRC